LHPLWGIWKFSGPGIFDFDDFPELQFVVTQQYVEFFTGVVFGRYSIQLYYTFVKPAIFILQFSSKTRAVKPEPV